MVNAILAAILVDPVLLAEGGVVMTLVKVQIPPRGIAELVVFPVTVLLKALLTDIHDLVAVAVDPDLEFRDIPPRVRRLQRVHGTTAERR